MPPFIMTEKSKYYYEYDRNDPNRPNPFANGAEFGYEYTPLTTMTETVTSGASSSENGKII